MTALALVLKDRHGRRFQCQLSTLQANPKLWDLVYNGMLHSACHRRVQSNARAREHLPLPGLR